MHGVFFLQVSCFQESKATSSSGFIRYKNVFIYTIHFSVLNKYANFPDVVEGKRVDEEE